MRVWLGGGKEKVRRMKMGWKPKTFRETIMPLAWLNWIWCLGVFEYPMGRPRVLFSLIYCIGCMFGYFALLIWQVLSADYEWVSYEKNLYSTLLSLIIFVSICSVILGQVNAKYLPNILDRCEAVDQTMEYLGVKKEYEKIFKNLIISVMFMFSMEILLTISDCYWNTVELGVERAIGMNLILHIPLFLNTVMILTFILMVRCVHSRFKLLNKVMCETFERERILLYDMRERHRWNARQIRVALRNGTRRTFIRQFIETVRQLHLEIVRIARDLNRVFCVQILFELLVQLVLVTFSLYNIYFSTEEYCRYGTIRLEKTMAMVVWCLVSLSRVFALNGMCSMTINEACFSGQIIREVNCEQLDQDTRDEIEQFSLQVLLNPMRFDACGFMLLRNESTRIFIGTSVTYLVILIQMSTRNVGTN